MGVSHNAFNLFLCANKNGKTCSPVTEPWNSLERQTDKTIIFISSHSSFSDFQFEETIKVSINTLFNLWAVCEDLPSQELDLTPDLHCDTGTPGDWPRKQFQDTLYPHLSYPFQFLRTSFLMKKDAFCPMLTLHHLPVPSQPNCGFKESSLMLGPLLSALMPTVFTPLIPAWGSSIYMPVLVTLRAPQHRHLWCGHTLPSS